MATIFLQICTYPVLAIMVIYLDCLREIGVGAEIRCQNVPEFAQLIHVPVWISPQRIKLVIIQEEMHHFLFWVLAITSCVIKTDKFAVPFEYLWVYLWYAIFTNTGKDTAVQIFVSYTCLSVCHRLLLSTSKEPRIKVFHSALSSSVISGGSTACIV